ncbi:hypothetical protein CSA57_12495 [candidate division KSB3 bacterium]|nr:MAG: hypothetical protein CSA57_12495 [candidate division KSB3 bacterium]
MCHQSTHDLQPAEAEQGIPLPLRAELKQPALLSSGNTPSLGECLAIYLLSGVLLVTLGAALQYLHLFWGLAVSQIAVIAGPALLYTILCHYDLPRSFFLRSIHIKTALLTVMIACSAFVPVMVVAALQELLLHRSPEYLALWAELMQKLEQAPFLTALCVIAVLPAVCEELFFRGFLLQGLRKKIPDAPAVIAVGILFGLFHLDFYRFLPVSLLGMLFACLVVKTGSIFPAILSHGINNAITLLLSRCSSRIQGIEQLDRLQCEALLSVEDMLGMLPIVIIASSILWFAFRALPGVDEEPPDLL